MKERYRSMGSLGVAVSLLTLAACGGGGGGASQAPTGSPVGSAPTGSAPTGTAPTETTAPPAGDLASICEAGSQEGALVYWNNLANPEPIFEAFNATYPDIQIESLQLRPDESAQRVLTEASAGRGITPDLIYGGIDVFKPLVDRGDIIATDTDWAALGIAEDTITDTGMVRLYRVAGGLVYNTDTHSAEELPNTWEELIDEQWRGQVVVDPRGRPFDQLSLSWGEEQTIDYVTRLKEIVQPIVIEGGTAGMVAVASGEAAITTGGRSAETLEQQAEGAPVEIKYLDIVPTLDAYHAVIAEAEHPNAARCWVGWLATEGKQIHDESEFKTNETIPTGAPEGAEILAIDTPEKGEQVSAMSDLLGPIWTNQ